MNHFQVFRDGKWSEEDASILVPGDIISIKLGDIIPADARLLDGDPLRIDQVTFENNNGFIVLLDEVRLYQFNFHIGVFSCCSLR